MDYYETRRKIVEFLNGSNISPYDLARISRDLCCCRTCRFFVQHYAKDGAPIAFGHCTKSNIPRAKQPNTQSCGYWDLDGG
jgi:hypothetical protein